MKITLEVTITDLESWDVDWKDDNTAQLEAERLENDARVALANGIGVFFGDIEVVAKFSRGN
jgi:hypothetical protein